MSTRVPIAPGTVLGGRYRIAGLAGEGGMGDIYEAMDLSLERRVALKRIRGSSEDSARERFRREALALAQLNHPSICQVFELAETAHGTFIAMEWIEGETLHARLRRGAVPWREAAEILGQTAEALAAAHVKGLVHRDLKPGNLMLTPEGRVKVLDFGLVRFAGPASAASAPPHPEEAPTMAGDLGESVTYGAALSGSGSGRALTLIGSFMGTLGYTSPEQALARPVTPASDVFNLGLLAQEMVTNQRAYLGEGRDALDAVVDNHREPFPRKFAPKPYRALTDRLLSPKPKDRPTAEEAAKAFQALIAPHGALWWSGLSAALVLLIGGAGLWLYSRGVIAGLVKGRPARVAVLGFKNTTGVPLLNAQTELGLADLVASRLRTEPKLEVLGADAIAQAARALKLDPANAAPEDQLRLAKALGADLVLSGEVDRRDGKDHLAFILRDAKGRTRTQGEAVAKPFSESTLDGIPLAQETARDIQKAVDPLGKDARPEPYIITPDAFAAYAQGVEAYRRGHYLDAEPLLAKVAYATPEWTDAVTAYAATLAALSRPDADAALRWALVSARKERNTSLESSVIRFLGILADKRRDFSAEKAYFEQGIALSKAQGDLRGLALCMNGLGRFAESQGDFEKAGAFYAEALQSTDRSGDLVMRTQILTNLGNLALKQGDLEASVKRYEPAVDGSRRIDDEAGEALGLNNLGIALFSQFKTGEAQHALERALALREKSGDSRGVASTCRNLGVNALIEDKAGEAEGWFRRAGEKAASIPDSYREGQALFFQAECQRLKGALNPALKLYQKAMDRSLAANDTHQQGLIAAAEAECFFRARQAPQAKATLQLAEKWIPMNPYLLRAQAWQAFQTGNRNEAQNLIRQAIEDPKHDAPELRPELNRLLSRFMGGSGLPSSQPSTPL